MEISFPTDMDGYISQECPSCEQRFRVCMGEGSDEPVSFCPYCGHEGHQCWYTPEQVDHMQKVTAEVVLGPELKKLERKFKGTSKGLLKVDMKSNLEKAGPPPMETDDAYTLMHFPCCNETIKATRHSHQFCIICGTEIDMTANDSKRVFLSHKGIDKGDVNDYQKTLELLGYDPWIDEDAMPAGTSLERGLLQGMQDSCGVVFFITPSFKDEGFLETEVNYAIAQKREKGDKFAIVALQFVDAEGNEGEIPELLKIYVWKKPKSELEALREIVRALLIEPKLIDWRDSIDGVVTIPVAKSTTTEMSHEAKTILKEAAAGDGHILHVRYMGGEEIQTNGKQLLPDREARTIAKWSGGHEDLQRRRYIKALGHKGESFEVTREGYEAVDAMNAE